MHTNKLSLRFALGIAALVASAGILQAATIVWQQPQNIVGVSDVSLRGTLVTALNFGANNANVNVATTVNGVGFLGANPSNYTSHAQGTAGQYGNLNSSIAPFATLPSEYNSLLLTAIRKDDAESTAGSFTITLLGLTVGRSYEVQIWVNDSRSNDVAYARQVSISTDGGSAVVLDANVGNTGGSLGQYVLGSFIATDITQTIGFSSLTTSGGGAIVNALQIRDVTGLPSIPEPGTAAVFAGMGTLAGAVALRRR